jgi:hypothetical protein
MKKFLFLFVILFAGFIDAEHPKFNETSITKVEQTEFPNATIYQDSLGRQYVEMKFAITPTGLVPEKGTPFQNPLLELTPDEIKYVLSLRQFKDAEKKLKQ